MSVSFEANILSINHALNEVNVITYLEECNLYKSCFKRFVLIG